MRRYEEGAWKSSNFWLYIDKKQSRPLKITFKDNKCDDVIDNEFACVSLRSGSTSTEFAVLNNLFRNVTRGTFPVFDIMMKHDFLLVDGLTFTNNVVKNKKMFIIVPTKYTHLKNVVVEDTDLS